MVLESSGGFARREVPQAEGLVPRAGEGVVAIAREHDVRNEVRVAIETLFRDAVLSLVAGQLPDDQGFVCGNNELIMPEESQQRVKSFFPCTVRHTKNYDKTT